MGHIDNILKRCQLVPINSSVHMINDVQNVCELEFLDRGIKWTVTTDKSFFVQTDSVSCGPIACSQMYHLMVDDNSFRNFDKTTIRPNVVKRYVYKCCY